MKSRSLFKIRAVLSQALFIVFLIMFCLSFQQDISLPAFTGEEQGTTHSGDGVIRTPSLFDLLWRRNGMSKALLKTGMPMIEYVEEIRKDGSIPSLPLQIVGWFIGYTPRGMHDLVICNLPKLLDDPLLLLADDPLDFQRDWGISPVLFSLPPGQEVTPATVVSNSTPVVAIYHTHATESYLPELGKKKASDAFTSDMGKSVVKVGEMLAKELEQRYRLPVLHSKTVHDEDSRLGAYYRSESTVVAIREQYPDCKVLVDVHRDSQPRSITGVSIGGKSYARMLLVIGTENPNWVSNYNFSRQIVDKLEDRYPGLTRGIMYASAVYNQKHSPLAILVEAGGIDNTFEECKNSMEALAWALASVILGAGGQ